MLNCEPGHAERPTGIELLHDPALNKGTSFSAAERDALGLRGLLPPRIFSQAERARRVMNNVRRKSNTLEKYLYLIGLQDRSEKLFYRVLADNLAELMPIIYTPTVGLACQEYSRTFRRPRGLFISKYDRGHIQEILSNWPRADVRVIVVTDGERILGLGDLGANGMGIPVGKLSLYTACAGIDPGVCLPIMIDVGTDNQDVLSDPSYIGLVEPRLRGDAYDALLDEFMAQTGTLFPHAMIQFEDFGNQNAFRLLSRHRQRYCMFNDDIQKTAAMTLSGLYSACRMTGGKLTGQRIVFFGAGVGLGIMASEAARVTDEMFMAAAIALDRQVSDADFRLGRIYPSLTRIRDVSEHIAKAVASVAFTTGLTPISEPPDLQGLIRSKIYDPSYVEIIPHHSKADRIAGE